MDVMNKALTLLVMIGSPHGRAYNRLFALLVILFGARFLYDAYRGVWRTGGIGWKGEARKAQWHDRIFMVLVGMSCLYLGSGLLSEVGSLPFVGSTAPVVVNMFSAVVAAVLAGIALFGAHRVWRTGMVSRRGELVKAEWFYKILLPALGAFFAGAAWLFLRRL